MRATFTDRLHGEADAAYRTFLEQGFPVVLDGVAETLQCASETDRSNWLIVRSACEDALAGGASPDDPLPLPLRCTSNRGHVVSYGQMLQLIADMRAWGFAAQGNVWRLKDLISAAQSNVALRAIDLGEGWP